MPFSHVLSFLLILLDWPDRSNEEKKKKERKSRKCNMTVFVCVLEGLIR